MLFCGGLLSMSKNTPLSLVLTPNQIALRRTCDHVRTLLDEMDASYAARRASMSDEEYEQCLQNKKNQPIDLTLERVLRKAEIDAGIRPKRS
jgi:hypothetical protein